MNPRKTSIPIITFLILASLWTGCSEKNIVGPGRITPEPPEPWSVLFGGDDGEKIFDLILDRNSQIYATGTFGSNEQSDNDILLVEYSLAGNYIRHSVIGGGENESGRALMEWRNSYIVAGQSLSYAANTSEIWVGEFNVQDDLLQLGFFNTFGVETFYDSSFSVLPGSFGDIIIGGNTELNAATIIALGEDGLQWEEYWSETYLDYRLYDMKKTGDGGFILCGTTNTVAEERDYFLMKTDNRGGQEWVETYGGDGEDIALAVDLSLDGGYVFTGFTRSYSLNDGELDKDLAIIHVDHGGSFLWEQVFEGTEDDVGLDILQMRDGSILAAGYSRSFQGDGGSLAYLVKTDPEGNTSWEGLAGDTGEDVFTSLVETPNGGFVCGGYSSSGSAGSYDGWLKYYPKDWWEQQQGE